MLARSALTTVLCFGVFLLVVSVPVAGAEADRADPVVTGVLDGLPVAAVEGGGSAALDFAGLEGERSAPVATPLPFSMVGFEVPPEATVWFRTSIDGVVWDDWAGVDVHPEEGPDPDSAEWGDGDRHFSHLVWVDEARHIQTRVGGASTQDVAIHLLDTKGLGRSAGARALGAMAAAVRSAPASASAAVAQPQIVTRSGWRADETRRRGTPSIASRVRVGVVHHTADGKSYSQSEAAGVVRGIYAYHTGSQGWADLGYNFLIDRFGTIYEGRFGGIDQGVVGAHAGGFNTGTFGVALLGDFTEVDAATAARRSLESLLAWKMELHHIDPSATSAMTSGGSSRYSNGTQVTLNTISGHRDVSATACPGTQLYTQLPSIRTAVGRAIGDMLVQPQVSTSAIRLGTSDSRPSAVSLSVGLQPSGQWELVIADRDGLVVHTDRGTGTAATSSWQPEAVPGVYTWTFSSTGRRSATGQISIARDVVDRIGTAQGVAAATVELSKAAFEDAGSASLAVLARADVFADAMSGGPLAGVEGPLLLIGSDSVDSTVRAELERVLPKDSPVYVLGGSGAIGDAVLESLEDRWDVQRVSGPDRTATAAAVADIVLDRSGGSTVMIARAGPDAAAPWADALAGGAYGARAGIPVLLTHTNELPPATKRALVGIDHTLVLGGSSAVSDRVFSQLPNARRISGADRAATAVAIATQLWGRTTGGDGDTVLLGSGFQANAWTLSLASAPLAARNDAPLLLSAGTELSPSTRTYLRELRYGMGRTADGIVLGGTPVIGERVLVELSTLLQ